MTYLLLIRLEIWNISLFNFCHLYYTGTVKIVKKKKKKRKMLTKESWKRNLKETCFINNVLVIQYSNANGHSLLCKEFKIILITKELAGKLWKPFVCRKPIECKTHCNVIVIDRLEADMVNCSESKFTHCLRFYMLWKDLWYLVSVVITEQTGL